MSSFALQNRRTNSCNCTLIFHLFSNQVSNQGFRVRHSSSWLIIGMAEDKDQHESDCYLCFGGFWLHHSTVFSQQLRKFECSNWILIINIKRICNNDFNIFANVRLCMIMNIMNRRNWIKIIKNSPIHPKTHPKKAESHWSQLDLSNSWPMVWSKQYCWYLGDNQIVFAVCRSLQHDNLYQILYQTKVYFVMLNKLYNF